MSYPNPDWKADRYVCHEGHQTLRYRLPAETARWNGAVGCSTCGRRAVFQKEDVPFSIVESKPEPVKAIHLPRDPGKSTAFSPTYADAISGLS